MDLYNIKSIKEILGRHGFHFSKSLGQNFLTAPWVTAQIAQDSQVDESCGVLEVGPGMGSLTTELAKAAGKVVAVEIDRALLPVLDETLSGYDNVTVIHGDILKEDVCALVKREFNGLRPLVCANLPYYITSPILTRLIDSRAFEAITVMLQKEVAERLCAKPGNSDYGAFTVYIEFYTQPEILFYVPADCFVPQPKVDSAVVRLKLRQEPPVKVEDEQFFFRVVHAAFAQRRKTLLNCLNSAFGNSLEKAEIIRIIEESGLDATVRGERLSIEDFAKLSENLKAKLDGKK